MSAEKHGFQTEVSRLLEIVAGALYSNKEVFLRELVSNAADACDKRRHSALTDEKLGAKEYKIQVEADKDKKTLTIKDNGIGMNKESLCQDLGTIARSGTSAFMEELSGDQKKDVSLIGQFGVGFYSAFMVADKVVVTSQRVGEKEAYSWTSEGKGEYEIDTAENQEAGTTITLHLKKEAEEYLEPLRLRTIINTYSDHLSLPIYLKNEEGKEEQINKGSALWTRSKSEITDEQYKEFYHHVGHAFDDPWLRLHYKVEGVIEYTNLLFIPSTKPFDLFDPKRQHQVKLYVKRVFITDECEDLMPSYLRFVKGIIDAEDLPLNISREMLQKNPLVLKIQQGVTKKILAELKTKSEKEVEEYLTFYNNFGTVLKEGLCDFQAPKEDILNLCRFYSANNLEKQISLQNYVDLMKTGQDEIYYITGEDKDALSKSPQLEAFAAKGVDVLLLTDPVDEFWLPHITEFKDKKFVSVTKGSIDLEKVQTDGKKETKKETPEVKDLIAVLKKIYGEKVKDVCISKRLTTSPVCLVAADGDMDFQMEKILKEHGKINETSKRILEVNPDHSLIQKLAKASKEKEAEKTLEDAALLLLDQALILEGQTPTDMSAFANRFAKAVEKGLAA